MAELEIKKRAERSTIKSYLLASLMSASVSTNILVSIN